MKTYIQTILRGFGQVMFQNSALSGLLFLVGISYNSLILGIAAIMGAAISTVTAQVLKYSKEDIEDGIYGFNGALVGVAAWFYFGVNPFSVLALIVASVLSSIIMKKMKKVVLPFTAPFVFITWVLIAVLIFVFNQPVVAPALAEASSFDLLSSISKGFSEVWFQDNLVTGGFFFLAILVNSRLSTAYAFYGALLGALAAMLLSQPYTLINGGIFGYNAVLCAIALGGANLRAFLMVTLAVILSVVINLALASTGIITLTSAFVLSTWIVLLVQFLINKPKKESLNLN